IDGRLLFALAELRPEWSFVVLGRPASDDLRWLDALDNVYVLPSVPASERPAYAAEFDVALLPLAPTQTASQRFPVEALELLAPLRCPAPPYLALARARGPYVPRLNADVQPPAGARLAFVDALARSRAIRLAGPVTNRVTNEACIDVDYDARHPAPADVDRVH